MIRRHGDPPARGARYILRPGVYAVLRRGDSVLLTVQDGPEPEVQLPGGGVDPGEQPLHALHREVFEETGWRIARPRRLGAFRRFVWMPEYDMLAEKICTVYAACPVHALGRPTDPMHAAVWAPVATARGMVADVAGGAFLGRSRSAGKGGCGRS
jgi:8-oxo-dGTP diphosphatase